MMMQIALSMKMIMNLCKQDRLDAWATFGLPLHIEVVFQKLICRTESVLHSSHALRCVAAYFFAKGADANEISFG